MAIAVSAAVAMPCSADVIDLTGGVAVTYAAPAVFTQDQVETIPRAAPVRPAQPAEVVAVIAEAAHRSRLDPEVVKAVAWQESRFHQSAVSNRGAVGVMQLTVGAAHDLGVDRFDLGQNINGGAAYLRRLMDRYGGDLRLSLAAYNAGPQAVDRYRDVPPYQETQAYVRAILARLPAGGGVLAAPDLTRP